MNPNLSLARTRLLAALCALAVVPLAHAERLSLPSLDLPKLAAEDRASDGKPGVPLRYGQVQTFGDKHLGLPERGLQDGGSWTEADDGTSRWWLQIEAAQARNLALHFEAFRLPAGAELRLYAVGEKTPSLVYTDADNTARGDLRTPMVEGQSLRIELHVPQDKRAFTRLSLGSVVQGYRDPFVALAQLKSGSCNIDVACPQGDAWRPQIRSVAHYTFNTDTGSFVCTGQLVATGNQGLDVLSPRFLTAHHCVSREAEAQSMTLYWRYESPTCRAPGSAANGQALARAANTAAIQSGASLLATHRATDFTIVALQARVPFAAHPWFTGWDRSGSIPVGAIGIHHPAGHEKRISIDNDPLQTGPNCIVTGSTQTTHWFVGSWDQGTTEGGSSGSGLWRRDSGRLIGVLSGGLASCAAREEFDCYGALDRGWSGGGAPTSRLSDWLTRDASAPQSLDGYGSCSAPQVSLESSVFRNLGRVGEELTFSVLATGGTSEGYRYEWDLDGDGVYERESTSPRVSARYATELSAQVSVRVTDSSGCPGFDSRALDVLGPRLEWNAGPADLQCGNGNGQLEPGERWRLPVQVTNTGASTLPEGAHALIVNGQRSTELPGGLPTNRYGYQATTSEAAPQLCAYEFVDIADQAPLPLTDEDDGRALIQLEGDGIALFGSRYGEAVMSTNGYISLSTLDRGIDYDNNCSGELDRGGAGPRIHVLHDDLVVSPTGGLRYRYFEQCPSTGLGSAAQPCHVFQWDGLSNFREGGSASFQAVVHALTAETRFHYRRADALSGGSATIGLIDALGDDPLNILCDQEGAVASEQSICIFDPANSPAAGRAILELESPTLALPAMAPGQTTRLSIPFRVPSDAPCGAAVSLDYVATAAPGQHQFAPLNLMATSIPTSCERVQSCPVSLPSRPLRKGFFSDPARSGNGLAAFVYEHERSAALGAIWYTADPNHLSDWFTLSGPWRSGSAELDVFHTRNETPAAFQPVTESVGRAWWASVDADSHLFAWEFEDGRRGAEFVRSASDGQAPPSPDRTNAWIPVGQSGWGLALQSLQFSSGTFEFTGIYLFDASGRPRWLVGSGGGESPGLVQLTQQRVHCPGCLSYSDYGVLARPAGTLQREFSSRTRATLSTTITLPAPLSGTWNRTNVEIQAFGESNP